SRWDALLDGLPDPHPGCVQAPVRRFVKDEAGVVLGPDGGGCGTVDLSQPGCLDAAHGRLPEVRHDGDRVAGFAAPEQVRDDAPDGAGLGDAEVCLGHVHVRGDLGLVHRDAEECELGVCLVVHHTGPLVQNDVSGLVASSVRDSSAHRSALSHPSGSLMYWRSVFLTVAAYLTAPARMVAGSALLSARWYAGRALPLPSLRG